MTIEKLSQPTPTQHRAFELLQLPILLSILSSRETLA